MKTSFLAFLITLLFLNFAQGQTITGQVKDAKTGEGLPFVNIGIIGRAVGTVSSDAGSYRINLSNHVADSLKFSMIGYRSQVFAVKELVNQQGALNISLAPEIKQLNEVKVTNRKWKTAILGNTTKSQGTTAGFDNNALGHEIGAIIKIKRSPTWLKQFNASIVENVITDSVKMRLNIYSVKDGMPDQNILNQNIFVTVHKGDKAININLEPYNVMVEDKFFISLEWIQSARGHGIMFSASLLSSAIIARETSQAAWEKVGIAGVGFNVLAEY
ncbi:carboxypeptidase-like regulatory domain-containing protein [Mucilaginibacter auburnensis]|uniref:Carboxypeptidase-like protein n=1 Tax=Mucilaginibacter auburnensis TaxID=1457233 RepID=A0A2H9VUN8_9SPHI|nr:carboxypeptidase-like regulatory domain-containing protein [Mucilaginibacter auburnensis]PJJ84544.1 carboxypeptidase-like protein [Mucilaginibacter auburnensis]